MRWGKTPAACWAYAESAFVVTFRFYPFLLTTHFPPLLPSTVLNGTAVNEQPMLFHLFGVHQLLAVNDCWPEATKLAKGEHTVRVHVRMIINDHVSFITVPLPIAYS